MKVYQKIIALLIFLYITVAGNAQGVQFVETSDIQRAMMEYKNRYNEESELPGYKIQYLFTTDRREMENTERRFDNFYHNIPHEWEHDQPYYRLYAGSFVNRSRAMQLLTQIREHFPASLLVNSTVTIDQVLKCREILN